MAVAVVAVVAVVADVVVAALCRRRAGASTAFATENKIIKKLLRGYKLKSLSARAAFVREMLFAAAAVVVINLSIIYDPFSGARARLYNNTAERSNPFRPYKDD